MATPTNIQDPSTGTRATVTEYGQLVVAPVDYNRSSQATVDLINTAYNLVEPEAGKKIVIDGIILTANKNVATTNATVTLYDATSPTTTTETLKLIELEMVKSTTVSLTGLNLLVDEGNFVNIKTDDDDIFVTLLYYRVPV